MYFCLVQLLLTCMLEVETVCRGENQKAPELMGLKAGVMDKVFTVSLSDET